MKTKVIHSKREILVEIWAEETFSCRALGLRLTLLDTKPPKGDEFISMQVYL